MRELLEANLEAMYEVVMSICNPVLKDQVCKHKNHKEINNKQDMLVVLQIIKKAMYLNRDDNKYMEYNHVVAVMNYYRVQQERFQSLQEYRDQFIMYRRVCEQGWCIRKQRRKYVKKNENNQSHSTTKRLHGKEST